MSAACFKLKRHQQWANINPQWCIKKSMILHDNKHKINQQDLMEYQQIKGFENLFQRPMNQHLKAVKEAIEKIIIDTGESSIKSFH